MAVAIAALTAENHQTGFGIDNASPRLSWRFCQSERKDWKQTAYEVVIERNGVKEEYRVESDQSHYVPWPSTPLAPREIANVTVRAMGLEDATEWIHLTLEASLLYRSEWKASMITGLEQPLDQPKKPFRLSRTIEIASYTCARLYATAYGIYEIEINGKRVGDQLLTPGWTSYHHRLNYQTYDIGSLLRSGQNEIIAHIGEGWYAGRLGKANRNVWGSRMGFMAQLELDGVVQIVTDEQWRCLSSPLLESEIYNGEVFDSNYNSAQSFGDVTILPFPKASLISPHAPPVRRVMEIKPVEIITTPKGRKVLDFGQNLVGWLRIERDLAGPGELLLRHAEVMEDGELGVRPLRTAQARAIVKLGGKTKGHEPKFTFYGFRYAEVTGINDLTLNDFTAIVISSDLRRTGHFSCSHEMITRLHENVVWGMRGNFVSLPTDCPQRDERLGWTGDIQVFSPTANFLFDTSAFLDEWMEDVWEEQKVYDGVPPIFVPWTPPPKDAINPLGGHKPKAHGAWADVVAVTPWDMYQAFGDLKRLERRYEGMVLWLEKGLPRAENGLWSAERAQYGDWLDPKAPPQFPAHGRTDFLLPANAYLVYTTGLVSRVAKLIGKENDSAHYAQEYKRMRQLFRDEYVTKNGRLVSDTQTAFTLALWFELLDDDEVQHAVDRLDWLIRWDYFKISSGFAGTPLILPNLAKHGLLHLAYRMLQERDNPSWLYSVGMGATTIWERWDSMLPDGSINPGQMTSFNHYALGSVASFLHNTVGGLSPLEPGWRRALVKPQPGGTVASAETSFDSPYGLYSVKWILTGEKLSVEVMVPPNGSAKVDLPGVTETVGSGKRLYEVDWRLDARWPPVGFAGPQSILMPDNYVA